LEGRLPDGCSDDGDTGDHRGWWSMKRLSREVLPGALWLAISLGSWLVSAEQSPPTADSTLGQILWQYETGG